MQSHKDLDAESFMDRLRQRADQIHSDGKSKFAGGGPDDEVLAEWEARGVHVRKLPNDEQGILRISIGGGNETPVPLNYCVFRGSHSKVVDLLRKTLIALEHGPE